MTIGTLDLGPRPVVLAPMEDVTDIGFRLLCRQMGASMVYSEFVSSDALVRNVNRSLQKLTVCPEERPVAIQIYGKFPDAMAEAARMVEEIAHPDVIDLNFGCPVKRVAVKGAGAGLLRNVPLMLEITRAVVNAVKVPVTAKTRLGWDHNSIIIDQLAEQLQDQGIQALTVHGRTRSQMYTGQADWEPIGRLKRNPRLKIPIIGNGDIASAEDALRAFEQYGVDAVMVGRATFGRPWIFREIQERVRSEEAPQPPKGEGWELGMRNEESIVNCQSSMVNGEPQACQSIVNGQSGTAGVSVNRQWGTTDWKLSILKQQVLTSIAHLDERRGILHSRRHIANSPLFKGIPNFRDHRIAMLRAETADELFRLIDQARPLIS